MTSGSLTVAAFALLTVALLLVDLRARGNASRWPDVGDVFSALMARPVARVLVMLGWWWLGWHFFVR